VAVSLNIDELTPDQRRELGLRNPRESQFTND